MALQGPYGGCFIRGVDVCRGDLGSFLFLGESSAPGKKGLQGLRLTTERRAERAKHPGAKLDIRELHSAGLQRKDDLAVNRDKEPVVEGTCPEIAWLVSRCPETSD